MQIDEKNRLEKLQNSLKRKQTFSRETAAAEAATAMELKKAFQDDMLGQMKTIHKLMLDSQAMDVS